MNKMYFKPEQVLFVLYLLNHHQSSAFGPPRPSAETNFLKFLLDATLIYVS